MNLKLRVGYLWIKIFSYLEPIDIFECDHVCRSFRSILSSNNDMIKDLFSVYFYISNYHLQWYSRRIKLLKIEKLIIDDLDSYLKNSEIRDLINSLDLKSLHLYLKYKIQRFRLYTLDKLTHLEELVIYSQQCIDQDQYQYLQNIKRISIRCNNFPQSIGLLNLTNLVSLDLWSVSSASSVSSDYYILIQVLQQNWGTLKELYIDAKQLGRSEMTNIIQKLNPQILTGFKVYSYKHYHVEHLDALSEFKQINQISISKAKIYNTFCFLQLIQFKSFVSVNFSQCESFNDRCLDTLTYYSPQLVKIDISYTQCSDQSVQRLFLNCLQLKEVDLSGLNLLTDKFLPSENDWAKILRHCKVLKLCSTLIPHQIIGKLKAQKNYIKIFL